jgi:hypothetical protein
MSVDVRRLAELDAHDAAKVPLGRSRLFRTMGVALVAVAVRMAATPTTVSAGCGPNPPMCSGGGQCCCCSGWSCCDSGCQSVFGYCPGGVSCWNVCYSGNTWQCCDYTSPVAGTPCVCAGQIQSGCG